MLHKILLPLLLLPSSPFTLKPSFHPPTFLNSITLPILDPSTLDLHVPTSYLDSISWELTSPSHLRLIEDGGEFDNQCGYICRQSTNRGDIGVKLNDVIMLLNFQNSEDTLKLSTTSSRYSISSIIKNFPYTVATCSPLADIPEPDDLELEDEVKELLLDLLIEVRNCSS